MSLLSTDIQVRPGVIHAIVELALCAGRPLTEDDYAALLQPAAIKELTGASQLTDPLPSGLRFCQEVGLITPSADGFVPASETSKLNPKSLHHDLPDLLSRLMLEGSEQGNEQVSTAMISDLLQSLAWLLSQNVWTTPSGVADFELLLEEQWPTGPRLINPEKERALREWGPYLGVLSIDPFATSAQSMLLLDPTNAVYRAVIGFLDSEIDASLFVAQLSARICIIDEGWKRLEVTEQIDKQGLPWERDQSLISPTLSLALHRLERRGVIKMTKVADTDPTRRRVMKMSRDSTDRQIDRIQPGEAFGKRRGSR